MLGDFASLDVQNTYRGSDAYDFKFEGFTRGLLFMGVRRAGVWQQQ
ncbi:hypothetical protein [Piscirickettsia salmonis]|nr:hypothetical protein [Piscirickettsia salmonis]QNR80489.1 hypothetical protein ICC15_16710 [Piscirickettsia salmonis]